MTKRKINITVLNRDGNNADLGFFLLIFGRYSRFCFQTSHGYTFNLTFHDRIAGDLRQPHTRKIQTGRARHGFMEFPKHSL
jgi:hypothetical protein